MKGVAFKTIAAALFAASVGGAWADTWSAGGGDDTKVSTAANWTGNAVPSDIMDFTDGAVDKTVTFDSAERALSTRCWIGSTTSTLPFFDGTTAHPVVWTATDSSYGLKASCNLVVADYAGPQNGALKISNGTYSFPHAYIGAWLADNKAYFEMAGGTLTFSGVFDLGIGNSTAKFVQSGGTITVNTNTEWARDGSATLTAAISGGATLFNADLILGNNNSSGTATIDISNGGVLQVGTDSTARWFKPMLGSNTVNLNEGGTLSLWHIQHDTTDGGTFALNFNGGALRMNGIDANSKDSSGNAAIMGDKATDAETYTVTVGAKGAIIATDFATSLAYPMESACASGTDGGLIKVGTGTLTLTATPTFTGPISVKCGKVVIPADSTYPGSDDYKGWIGDGTQAAETSAGIEFSPKRQTVLDLDFETESNTNGWIFGGNGSGTWATYSGTTDHFLEIWSGNSGSNGSGRTGTAEYAITNDLGTASDYVLLFDTFAGFGYTASYNCYTKVLDAKGNQIFQIYEPQATGSSGTVYFYDSTGAELGSWNVIKQSKNSKNQDAGGRGLNADATPENWLSVTVCADQDYGVFLTVKDYTGEVVLASVRVGAYAVPNKIMVQSATKMRENNTGLGVDNIVVTIPAAAGLPDDPNVAVDSNSEQDARKVTITPTSSNVDTYYYLLSAGAESAVKIPEGGVVTLTNSDTVVAYSTNTSGNSNEVKLPVTACAQPAPTLTITGVNGNSRTVTVAYESDNKENCTLQYKKAEDGEYADLTGTTLTTDKTVTYHARVKRQSAVDTSLVYYSDVTTFAVTAGEEVVLASPTIRVCGINTLRIDPNQGSTLCKPTAKLYYSVGTDTTAHEISFTGSYAYLELGDNVNVEVSIWAEADGYANSEPTTWTQHQLSSAEYIEVISADFAKLNRDNPSASMVDNTKSGTENVISLGQTTKYNFMQISMGDDAAIDASEVVYLWEIGSNKSLRWQNGISNAGIAGIFSYSTQKPFAIRNCKQGDIVYVNSSGFTTTPCTMVNNDTFDSDDNLTEYSVSPFDNTRASYYERYFTVDEDGDCFFAVAKGVVCCSVRVFRKAAASIGSTAYETVQAAVDAYESGTLTVYKSETVTLKAAKTISNIVLADGVTLSVANTEPFTTAFDAETKTLSGTRHAATFVYAGEATEDTGTGFDTASNFTIGGTEAIVAPGEQDTVQFDNDVEMYLGSSKTISNLVVNADVKFTSSNYRSVHPTVFIREMNGTGTNYLYHAGIIANGLPGTIASGVTINVRYVSDTVDSWLEGDVSTSPLLIYGKIVGSGYLICRDYIHFSGDNSGFTGKFLYTGNNDKHFMTSESGFPSASSVTMDGSTYFDFTTGTIAFNNLAYTKNGGYVGFNVLKDAAITMKLTGTSSIGESMSFYMNDSASGDFSGGWNAGAANCAVQVAGAGSTLSSAMLNAYKLLVQDDATVTLTAALPSEIKAEAEKGGTVTYSPTTTGTLDKLTIGEDGWLTLKGTAVNVTTASLAKSLALENDMTIGTLTLTGDLSLWGGKAVTVSDSFTANEHTITLGTTNSTVVLKTSTAKVETYVSGCEVMKVANGDTYIYTTKTTVPDPETPTPMPGMTTDAVVSKLTSGTDVTTGVYQGTDGAVEIIAITNKMATTIVAVPFSGKTAADVVTTTNLAEGDKLYAYDTAEGAWKFWKLTNGAWAAQTTLDETGKAISSDPASTRLTAGDAFMLQRVGTDADLTKPFYIYGMPASVTAPTLTAGATTLLANPKMTDLDLDTAVSGTSENLTKDEVVVPGNNMPRVYTRGTDGKWGYQGSTAGENGFGVVTRVTDGKIPAGTGFWYKKASGSDAAIDYTK